jgi:diguanylate cyclase (GGDEF)-like protein
MTAPLGVLLPDNDPRQSLRVRRFLLAALVYTVAIGLMGLYVRQGLLSTREWVFASLVIVILNTILYVILRSGRNERFGDPSLTGIQMFFVCLVMGMTMYLLDGGRGGMLLLFLVLLMFGVLRLTPRQFTALGGFALFSYAAALAAVWQQRPEAFNAQVELLHLAALGTLVPCGGFFAAHVSGLRRALRERQIELQRSREEVHDLKVLDPLTKISNRSAIIGFLTQEIERAERLSQPLTVIFIDLLHFKQVNREHGHAVGDEVLQSVAAELRQGVRDVDGLGRYSGEEFLVILPDTAEAQAQGVAQKLGERIERSRFAGLPALFSLQCLWGIAERSDEQSVWPLIERARASAVASTEGA